MRYSPTTKTFYSDEIGPAYLPQDAETVTEAERLAILQADVPPPEAWEAAKMRALALLKTERAPILSVLDGLQSTASSKGLAALLAGDNLAAEGYSETAAEIEALKQALKDAPAVVPFANCEGFEEMRLAGKAYYASLVQNASLDVKTAFREAA